MDANTTELLDAMSRKIDMLSYQISAMDKRLRDQTQIALIEMDNKVLNIIAMIPTPEGMYIKVK